MIEASGIEGSADRKGKWINVGKIYQCVGRYAETAYTIKRTWIHVYCVEELCFYICNNAYLLEKDFMNQDMLLWLESECMLPIIAKELRALIRQGARLEEQVKLLLERVHYGSAKEIGEVVEMISANDSMNTLQKNKIRADYFLRNGRYALALQSYEDLQDELVDSEDKQLIASVFYNMGVIYAHLFLFEQAGLCFRQAYDKHKKEEYQIAFLAAEKLAKRELEYQQFVEQQKDAGQAARLVDNTFDRIRADWKKSDENMKLFELARLRESGKYEVYSKQMEKIDNACKEQYRNMVLE